MQTKKQNYQTFEFHLTKSNDEETDVDCEIGIVALKKCQIFVSELWKLIN